MADDTTTPNSAQSPVSLDLDALQPAAAEIKLGGNTISVRPLDVPDYAKLIDLYNSMGNLKEDETDPEKLVPIYDKMRGLINEIIPELANHSLSLQQLLAVFNLLIDANSPQDKALAELAKRGITVKSESDGNSDPKVSTSPEPSPGSSEATPATE